ncbi:hypothetical protein KI688_011745 [Linnemannia hyalina]|uniref:RNI-like protein n=1 Tax=Linnemannia hyalina TaxID=64524 RepID=A0A9P7XVR5_9FUNG|nr:hypothetical protein KI688_011745 [Linnemannia hyalina]
MLIGYAGKGYIRTFSLAGTTDCQAPRPFPYLPSCITDRHLNAISPSLTHLTSISLSHCTALTDMAVIQLITLSSPYLKRIDLTECRLLTNLTVQVMASLCSELEELSLQGCGLVTDDAIEEVALHCTRLHRINIGQCQRAGDKSLEALLRASGRMTHLSSFSRVRTRNARLTKLGVAGCKGITYSGLSAITEQLNAAGTEQDGYLEPQRSSLVSLDFTCPAVKAPTAENMNGLSVSTVATTAASTRTQSQASRFFRTLPVTLEEISIHDAYTLSHSDIIALVDQVGPGLKVLRLDHANAINSETLGHVLAVCPNLTVLSIPRASRLDDSGVVQLIGARCAGSLVELDLSACHSLTDGCLTALAKCTLAASSRTSTFPENDKGKGIQEQPNPCLFPNLRRLDLSYNDKMTLAGIIPLVMSLKNLCALDVSFCGDGVTRSWSSTLESLRPILNPTSASSTMDSTGIDNLLGDAVIESDHSEDDESSSSSQQQYSPQQEQLLQFSPHMASSTGVQPPPQEYGLSSQNLQRFMNGVAPLVSPSRLGLGRYVGPLLNRGTSSNNITNTDDDIVPQHPQQYSRQGGTSLDRTPLGNRRRSSASSLTSSSSTSTIMSSSSSGSSSTSSSMTSDCSSSSSSSGSKRITHSRRRSCSRIHLADRLDVLENTPRRVGIAASFHLESWFTPQHQLQLQHLFQIQSQHQRDLQEIQAAAANQMLFNPQNAGTAANLFANSMPFEALSAEMMSHPVMTAIRVGAATVGGINNGGGPPAHGNGNGVGGGGGGGGRGAHGGLHGAGGNNATSQNLFDSHTNNNETTSPPAHHGSRRLSVTAGEGGGGGGGGGGVRHHHRHHYQHPHYHHRRNPLSSAATGHCEISAWGLIKLREEWAAVI